jgi:AcrR family transcriptional regulator
MAPSTRDMRRQKKRARILAAARSLLVAQGYDRLSLRAVARRARCSPAGMYELFADKEDLVEHLGEEASARLARALVMAGRRAADPVDRLVTLGLGYIRFARRNPDDFLLLFSRRQARRRSLVDQVPPDSPYAMIRGAVAATTDVSGVDARLLEALAYGYWSTVHGMAMLQLTHLAGFRADFDAGSRIVLESMAEAWHQRSWRPS